MPIVPETAWGHWGSPSPVAAWNDSTPAQLHGSTGGVIKPRYADTLEWYYKRAKDPRDKDYCLKLLTKLELQKSKEQKTLTRQRRPQTAPKQFDVNQIYRQKTLRRGELLKPSRPSPSVEKIPLQRTTYQKQLEAAQRLSRPKTAKLRFEQNTSRQEQTRQILRPKSAMADLGRRRINDPYLTSHQSDFPGYSAGLDAQAVRPMTSKGVINPIVHPNQKLNSTTFVEQYGWKTAPRTQPIRSGTSSGNRSNNAHPQNAFMVWRLARKNAAGQSSAPGKNRCYRDLSDKMMNQILADKMKSTYQSDFLGIPQGYQVNDAIDCPADWRDNVPRPKATTVRFRYKNDPQEPELVGNTTRYGCNRAKSISAFGIVPTVTKDHVMSQEAIKGKTSYENFYENNFRQEDLNKLQKQQDSQKLVNQFLRYARTFDQDGTAEKTV